MCNRKQPDSNLLLSRNKYYFIIDRIFELILFIHIYNHRYIMAQNVFIYIKWVYILRVCGSYGYRICMYIQDSNWRNNIYKCFIYIKLNSIVMCIIISINKYKLTLAFHFVLIYLSTCYICTIFVQHSYYTYLYKKKTKAKVIHNQVWES